VNAAMGAVDMLTGDHMCVLCGKPCTHPFSKRSESSTSRWKCAKRGANAHRN
jgi:hypothetical protein